MHRPLRYLNMVSKGRNASERLGLILRAKPHGVKVFHVYGRQTNPDDIHSGGKALQAVVRPYPKKIAGKPVRFTFDPDNRHFAFEFDPNDPAAGPTEIFVPTYQYPDGFEVTLSAGTYEKDSDAQVLRIKHTGLYRHRVEISPIILHRYH